MFTKGLPTENFEKSGGLDELEKLQLFWSEEIVQLAREIQEIEAADGQQRSSLD